MVGLARSLGCAAKFTGSGGAVVVLCPDGQAQAGKLKVQASAAGFSVVQVIVGQSGHQH